MNSMQNRKGMSTSERVVAEREGYDIKIIRWDMTKPLPFEDSEFSYFWKKNHFEVISEADVNGWPKLVAERKLRE